MYGPEDHKKSQNITWAKVSNNNRTQFYTLFRVVFSLQASAHTSMSRLLKNYNVNILHKAIHFSFQSRRNISLTPSFKNSIYGRDYINWDGCMKFKLNVTNRRSLPLLNDPIKKIRIVFECDVIVHRIRFSGPHIS